MKDVTVKYEYILWTTCFFNVYMGFKPINYSCVFLYLGLFREENSVKNVAANYVCLL